MSGGAHGHDNVTGVFANVSIGWSAANRHLYLLTTISTTTDVVTIMPAWGGWG